MINWKVFFVGICFGWLVLVGINYARANQNGELSLTGNFSKTNYGNNTYSTTRRYTASIGYNLTPVTELELSYIFADTFFNQDPIQTTSINEQALSLSVVQALLPAEWLIQPYVKAGAAQFNRRQSGTIGGVPTRESYTKSPSALLGGGLRIFLLRNFSLNLEVLTYIPDFKISEAKNNFAAEGGLGWHF